MKSKMEEERNDYYKRNGVEVKEILSLIYRFFGDDLNAQEGFYLGNVIKYLMRFKFKGNPEQDLNKLEEYLSWLRDSRKEQE